MLQLTSRIAVTFFLLCSIIANSVGPAFTSLGNIDAFAKAKEHDAMLLCTGSSMKWVSFSAFDQLGEIVEITPPPASDEQPPCPLFLFDKVQTDFIWSLNHIVTFAVNVFSPSAMALHNTYLKSLFTPLVVRGPPA